MILALISIHTPIFPSVVGTLLEQIGNHYGKAQDGSHPELYVILGGGLSSSANGGIKPNSYTYKRSESLWQAWQAKPLSIVASGVEAPWIGDTIKAFAQQANTTPPIIHGENASMNTCENARFSAKLIAHEAALNASHIYLISDWYHMARARRQFAKAGIATTAIIAPMPTELSWTDPASNRNHSRRAFYESVALMRDIFRPQLDCRSADDLSINTLKTPRRRAKTFD